MYENLNQWHYVLAAYGIGFGGVSLMAAWSWLAMQRAEARREKAKRL